MNLHLKKRKEKKRKALSHSKLHTRIPQPQSINYKTKLLSNKYNQHDNSKLYRNFINNHNLEIKTILQYQTNYSAKNYINMQKIFKHGNLPMVREGYERLGGWRQRAKMVVMPNTTPDLELLLELFAHLLEPLDYMVIR